MAQFETPPCNYRDGEKVLAHNRNLLLTATLDEIRQEVLRMSQYFADEYDAYAPGEYYAVIWMTEVSVKLAQMTAQK